MINITHGNNEIPEKICHLIISYCFVLEDMSKTQASCFITGSRRLETDESTRSYCFSLFGTLGEASPWFLTFYINHKGSFEILLIFTMFHLTKESFL